MMSGISSYNAAVGNWFETRGQFAELLHLLLALHATTPNPVLTCEQEWKKLKKAGNLTRQRPLEYAADIQPKHRKRPKRHKSKQFVNG